MKRLRFAVFILAVLTGIVLLAACTAPSAPSTGTNGSTDPVTDPSTHVDPVFSVTVDDGAEIKEYKKKADEYIDLVAYQGGALKMFIGWQENGTHLSYDESYRYYVSKDAVLNALYCDAYTIYLAGDSKEFTDTSVEVGLGQSYTLPVPTKEGSVFKGWYEGVWKYTDIDGVGIEPYRDENDIYLTAKWQELAKYIITVRNGTVNRKGDDLTSTDSDFFIEGNKVTLRATTVPDMRFVGWQEGDAIVSKDEEYIFVADKARTLTAIYEEALEVTVVNGRGGGEYSYLDEVTVSIRPNNLGKQFLYWRDVTTGRKLEDYTGTDADGNLITRTTDTEAGTMVFTVTESVTLEAVFKQLEYNVRYYVDDRLLDISAISDSDPLYSDYEAYYNGFSKKLKYNDNVPAPAYSPEADPFFYGKGLDLVFSGWTDKPDKMPAEDLDVHGTTATAKYIVTAVNGIGGGQYDSGTEITLTPNELTGKSFVGWHSALTGTIDFDSEDATGNKLLAPDGSYTFSVKATERYEALFEDVYYTLSYFVYGWIYGEEGGVYGSLAEDDTTTRKREYSLKYGDSIPRVGAPTVELYDFSGWSALPQSMPDHDVIIVGSFAKKQYKVTIIDGYIDEVGVTEKMVEAGSQIVVTPVLETGWGFSSWRSGNKILIDKTQQPDGVATFTVTGEAEIYLVAERVRYRINWYVDDTLQQSSLSDMHYYGDAIAEIAAPTKDGGNRFSGWHLDDGSQMPDTMPAEDLNVYGYFYYVISVEGGYIDGDMNCYEKEVIFGTHVTITAVVPADKEFDSWTVGSHPYYTQEADVVVTSDLIANIVFKEEPDPGDPNTGEPDPGDPGDPNAGESGEPGEPEE